MPVFEISPGNALAYDYRPPAAPAAVTFVYFNALTGDKSMWETAVDAALAPSGHGMLAFNYRGQAGSPFTAASFSEASIVADAAALIQHLQPPRPVYVGLSIGGLFAARTYLDPAAPSALGLAFINTLRRDGQRLRWLNDALVRAVEVGGLDLLRDLYAPLLFNEQWQRDNRQSFLKDTGYAPPAPGDGELLLLKSAATADWDLPLERIRIPVLNVTGLQDRVFLDSTDVEALLQRLPDARRVDMADAGHLIPAERPAALAESLAAFAARCAGPRAS